MKTPENEFSIDPFIETDQTLGVIKTTIEYLKRNIQNKDKMLDLGRESPLTLRIRDELLLIVDNTDGDLDVMTLMPYGRYKYILYSHTIEHQFNPLHTLLELKQYVMRDDSVLFIILPNKPKMFLLQ